MDKFDQTFQGLLKLTPVERRKQIETFQGMCICPGCPTHTECAKKGKELLYCATGGSFICITEDYGCLCPTCPITSAAGLTYDRFCLRGDEFKQRYLAKLK